MKGHLGAVLTSGLAAVALALALLQAVVLAQSAPRTVTATVARSGATNRYSVPGGRSGVPYLPFDRPQPAEPGNREGRTPRPQEEHRAPPPPSRLRGTLPHFGPQPARKAAA